MNIKSIRRELFRYLDLTCHLWNAYFSDLFDGLDKCEPLDTFELIDNNLFVSLVCRPLSIQLPEDYFFGQRKVVKEIVVAPISDGEIVVRFRELNSGLGQIWNKSEVVIGRGMSCFFMEFFQWHRYNYRNFPFVRCMIVEWPERQDFVGREVLLKTEDIDFFRTGIDEGENLKD